MMYIMIKTERNLITDLTSYLRKNVSTLYESMNEMIDHLKDIYSNFN